MKLHRFRHNSHQDEGQAKSQQSLRHRRGVLVLLAFLLVGLVIAVAPGGSEANRSDLTVAIPNSVKAQDSPLSSPLSVALNTEASPARRANLEITDPSAGDQRNLLRVAALIAGVLLVTVIVWRQR